MTRWLWQLKWALVIAIFAGPAISYFSYNDQQRIQRIMSNGAELTALVSGGHVERGRRGSVDYSLDLSWVDAEGATISRSIDVSDAYAESIILNDAIMIDHTQIKYLAGESDNPVVVVDDAPNQLETDQFGIWLGIAAGMAGLILAPIWFWLEARAKRKQDDDIDATLAKMRAGQTQ
jgi:hypothetical protein